ncbi:hypothetical protein [Pseudoalteromonas sp. DY56-GL79]|uniref:hypothetical protein n=1 Tax=Pseudoalteromonas sp. DY56-GL79 TaxID=2967131 RepID=UPI00352B989A
MLEKNNYTGPSLRVGLHSCEELFEKLKWEYSQLQEDWSNSYITFNFVLTANHLYADWVTSQGTKIQRQKVNRLPELGKQLFAVLRDVANASKHWQLDRKSEKKKVVESVSKPIIGDWFSYFISGPVPYISVGEANPSLPELASVTIKCFEWILVSEELNFPIKLAEELQLVFLPRRN